MEFGERITWALGSCTVLVAVCQLLVFFVYPLLAPRSPQKGANKNFHHLQRAANSEIVPVRESPQGFTGSSAVSCVFPSHRTGWAALIEAFFLGLAGSTLISDALFHLIPEALISVLESSALLNGSSHITAADVLNLGFWAIGGMLLVTLVEALVHSNIPCFSIFRWCNESSSHDSHELSPRERLEICNVRGSSFEHLVTPEQPRTGPDFEADHHHCSNSKEDNRNVHPHPNHHHDHHTGLCNHGFTHLILEDEERYSEDDDDACLDEAFPLPHQEVSCPKSRRNSNSFESSSNRKSQAKSQLTTTDASPSTDHADELTPVQLERPHTAPGSLPISESKTFKENRNHYHHHHVANPVKQIMLRSTAVANLIAELLHNFVVSEMLKNSHIYRTGSRLLISLCSSQDGLAIGIAFLSGPPSIGIATSIAIFAHEVPSQIADFIILLRGGFSPFVAYCLNFGVAVGIHIGAVAALLGMLLLHFIAVVTLHTPVLVLPTSFVIRYS